jgi:hypothetical protein
MVILIGSSRTPFSEERKMTLQSMEWSIYLYAASSSKRARPSVLPAALVQFAPFRIHMLVLSAPCSSPSQNDSQVSSKANARQPTFVKVFVGV